MFKPISRGKLVIRKILQVLRQTFDFREARLAIVRRYRDANGFYVGELYVEGPLLWGSSVNVYRMVGVSLDSLPLNYDHRPWRLDTKHSFLDPMPKDTVRVGSQHPNDNQAVKDMIASLPLYRRHLTIQNRFIAETMPIAKRNGNHP